MNVYEELKRKKGRDGGVIVLHRSFLGYTLEVVTSGGKRILFGLPPSERESIEAIYKHEPDDVYNIIQGRW